MRAKVSRRASSLGRAAGGVNCAQSDKVESVGRLRAINCIKHAISAVTCAAESPPSGQRTRSANKLSTNLAKLQIRSNCHQLLNEEKSGRAAAVERLNLLGCTPQMNASSAARPVPTNCGGIQGYATGAARRLLRLHTLGFALGHRAADPPRNSIYYYN